MARLLTTVVAYCIVVDLVLAAPQPSDAKPGDKTAERIRQLLARIDESPDPLHFDYTPAVNELIDVGPAALGPTLELILSDNYATRLHAHTAISGIILTQYSFVFGQGWKDPEGEKASKRFWDSMGGLYHGDSREKREASVKRWREWLASQKKK